MPYVIKLSNKVSNEEILNSIWFILGVDILIIIISFILTNQLLNDIQTKGCISMRGGICDPIHASQNVFWLLNHEVYIATVFVLFVILPIQLSLRKLMFKKPTKLG